MAERWILTPTGGRPLVLPHGALQGGCQVIGVQTPSPARRVTYAQRPEGSTPVSREWENRDVTLQLQLFPRHDEWATTSHDFGAPAAEAEGDGDVPGWTGTVRRVAPDGNPIPPMLSDITSTVAAVAAAGGTLRRVLEDGTFAELDVQDDELSEGPTWDVVYYTARAMTVTVKMGCAPFWNGLERLLGEATKTTDRRLVVVGGLQVPGDVDALVRLEYSGATTPQRSLLYAIDQPSVATAATGPELAMSDLVAPEGTVGVDDNDAYTYMQPHVAAVSSAAWRTLALLRRTSDGQPLPIAGTHRVLARLRSAVSASDPLVATGATFRARLRWTAGAREAGLSENAEVTVPVGPWVLVDLGHVVIPDDLGALDGAIEVAGPVGGTIRGDLLLLVPTDRSAVASASLTPAVAGIPSAVDPLTGTGAVGGSAAQLGGSWTAIGSGPAWTRGAGGAQKSAGASGTTNPGSASAVALPVATLAGTVSVAAPSITGADAFGAFGLVIGNAAGIASLLTNSSSAPAGWAISAWVSRANGREYLALLGVGGGKRTSAGTNNYAPSSHGRPYLDVRTDGTAVASFGGPTPAVLELPPGAPSTGLLAGIASMPMTGSPSALQTVQVRDFAIASAVAPDAVLFPGKTATVTTARATRTTAAGMSGAMSVYRGDRPKLPPSGRAGRPVRVVLGTSAGDLRDGREVASFAPFTARVFATPRYLQIPDQNA